MRVGRLVQRKEIRGKPVFFLKCLEQTEMHLQPPVKTKEEDFLSLYEGQSFSFFSRLCNSRDLGKNKQGDSAKVGFSPSVATRTADLNESKMCTNIRNTS